MANQRLVDIVVADALSILTTAESSAVVIPSNASVMYVSSDTVVSFRVASGGNGFRIPANWIHAIDVSGLRTKSVYFHNATGGTAAVSISYKLWNAEDT